ncbi:MAG: single-stranded-DNA-specific exonuclease RecJ [Clostridia bacterium]|nr:single-stranded-DNA-specific exonuclease RecJ [Clostridia bacterium]
MELKKREKIWDIRYDEKNEEQRAAAERLCRELDVSETIAKLLCNRGYTEPEQADRFLKNEENILHDPLQLKDINEAVDRIELAISQNEKTVIYGDYDVDGVTAVSMMWLYLKSRGADVEYYIPSRSGEGYGLSRVAIDNLARRGISLIITVDTGITANEEADYAASLGIDMVITDHHECRSELPSAIAVVNPHRPDCKYPFKELAGVGVVFKVLCACEILRTRRMGGQDIDGVRRICYEYADLAAIGTVADVMPITDENRLIVSLGLRMIADTRRYGLAALIEASSNPSGTVSASGARVAARKRKITSNYIGYGIAPRLNAAGRMCSATIAVKLLLAEDVHTAAQLADELCEINRQRQIEENRIAEQAYKKIEKNFDFSKNKVIVLEDDNWQQGIIGIVSSRITEKFGLPSVLISFDGSTRGYSCGDDTGKGSGRSVKGMNLVDALTECEDLLVKFGGHELAAGLTIERSKVPEFIERINAYAEKNLSDEALTVSLEADCSIKLSDITMSFATDLYHLEPFGVSNPVPTFVAYDLRINKIMSISGGKHIKLILSDGQNTICAMCFNMPISRFSLHEGEYADVLFSVDINEFQNTRSVQMILQDIRMSRRSVDELKRLKQRYEQIKGGGEFDVSENFIPDRNDFALIYTVLRRECRLGHDALSDRTILSLAHMAEPERDINYVKLMYILRVFRELKICSVEKLGENLFGFEIAFCQTKTSIDRSSILKKLKSQCTNWN